MHTNETETLMRLQLDVPDDLKMKLKIQAAKTNRTMSDIAKEALEAYFRALEKAEK